MGREVIASLLTPLSINILSRILKSVVSVGENCDLTSAFDSLGQFTLMHSAGSSDSSGKDLASFADETAEFSNIFVVDEINFVSSELANFLSLAIVLAEGFLFSIHFTILLYYF